MWYNLYTTQFAYHAQTGDATHHWIENDVGNVPLQNAHDTRNYSADVDLKKCILVLWKNIKS